MTKANSYIGLDVGTVRIGVAAADPSVRIAIPHGVVEVDGSEVRRLAEIILQQPQPVTLVVGYPRNQSGEATQQSQLVEEFVAKLSDIDTHVYYQDESLTSVMAEDRLKATGRPYAKADIDTEAAVIILQDYLDTRL